eukprot:TRINITY_DN3028_c3_g1_i1.p1 TRINITY_DN3028_c3_g1~~TRINITY_DN3028_c3_g1_i1.p1  ORF type:complete len:613 (+),score=113.56 TRINITY_DN3028_c3_g1_i1:63-1841(+)
MVMGILPSLCLLVLIPNVEAAGGTKLWELGFAVEDNPLTVFLMFCFVVFLTIVIELAKHSAETKTKDRSRRKALGAVYAELMMVGVISFLLILTAELGVLDIRLGDCDSPSSAPVDPNTPLPAAGSTPLPTTLATPAPVTSASGSASSSECGIGFDLILFEYAHLVLFFMGLTYCVFMLAAFFQRDRMCKEITELQETSLHDWYVEKPKPMSVSGIMGAYMCLRGGPWARSILTMRAAIVVHHEDTLKAICDPKRVAVERKVARHRRLLPPGKLPAPEDAVHQFDISRFAKLAMSEVLVELLHIPPVVWGAVLFLAAANLIHKAGLPLADAMIIASFFGPILGIVVLWRISIQLSLVIQRSAGHPDLARVEFKRIAGATPLNIDARYTREGIAWAQGGEDPWEILTGCCVDGSTWDFLDPLDPLALERQIQIVIFASCFFTGQICMLSTLIFDTSGIGALLFCWLTPIPPLLFWVPRTLMIYALVHRSKEAPQDWLKFALQLEEDPEPSKDVGTHFHEEDGQLYNDHGEHVFDRPNAKLPHQTVNLSEDASQINAHSPRHHSPAHGHPTRYQNLSFSPSNQSFTAAYQPSHH